MKSEKDLKKQAKELAKELGVKLTVAQNELAKQLGHPSWGMMVNKQKQNQVIHNYSELTKLFKSGTFNVVGCTDQIDQAKITVQMALGMASNMCKVRFLTLEIFSDQFFKSLENKTYNENNITVDCTDYRNPKNVIETIKKDEVIFFDHFHFLHYLEMKIDRFPGELLHIVRSFEQATKDKDCTVVMIGNPIHFYAEETFPKPRNFNRPIAPKYLELVDNFISFRSIEYFGEGFSKHIEVFHFSPNGAKNSFKINWDSESGSFLEEGR